MCYTLVLFLWKLSHRKYSSVFIGVFVKYIYWFLIVSATWIDWSSISDCRLPVFEISFPSIFHSRYISLPFMLSLSFLADSLIVLRIYISLLCGNHIYCIYKIHFFFLVIRKKKISLLFKVMLIIVIANLKVFLASSIKCLKKILQV